MQNKGGHGLNTHHSNSSKPHFGHSRYRNASGI